MKLQRSQLVLSAALFIALAASAAAAEPATLAVAWQGVKAPIPKGTAWAASCVSGGKVFLFGGTSSSPAEPSTTLAATQIYDPATDTWERGADMPTPRYLATAAGAGGKIYVMGGRDADASGGGTPKNANEAYDPATDTWTAKSPLPVAMRGQACAVFGGRIYLFGGLSGEYEKAVRIYDPASDGWSSGADLPGPRAFGAAVYLPSKGRIYVIGGERSGDLPDRYLGDVIAYDPLSNAWDASAIPMLEAVSSFGCAADPVSGKVYLFSGAEWDAANNRDGGASFRTQVLDPATAVFSRGPSPPSPLARQEASAAYVSGKIYLMGGPYAPRLVDALDPAAGTWQQPVSPLPRLGDNPSLVGLGGKIYLVGGVNALDYNAKVYAYDPTAGTWSASQSSIPYPRYGSVAAPWGGKIAVSGGTARRFNTYFITGDTFLYDPASDSSTSLPPDPGPRTMACGAAVNGVLYVFGGYDGKSDVAYTRALDLATGAWSSKASLPNPLEQACAAACAGKIYICGGVDGTSGKLNERLLIYDPTADAFTAGPAMPLTVYKASASQYQNRVLVYGGEALEQMGGSTYTRPAPFLQVYDLASGTWSTLDGLWARSNQAAAVLDGKLYMSGGDDAFFLSDRLDVGALSGSVPPPSVTSMAKMGGPFRIDVLGANLQNGIVVFIGGVQWPSSGVQWKSSGEILIKGGKALKAAVPKGTPTVFTLVNPDGGEAAVTFQWP